LERSSAALALPHAGRGPTWRQGPAIGVAAGASWRCFFTLLHRRDAHRHFLYLQPIQALSNPETINETFNQY
jgi:hypothetical protein